MKDLRNKVIVITGAGSGIGRALSEKLTKEGSRLALCDIDIKSLDETKPQQRTVAIIHDN